MYNIIVNPKSRSGKSIKIWHDTLEPFLKEMDVEYSVFVSTSKGSITEFVKDLQTKNPATCYNFVVLGGDGTLNEFVNGIVDFSKVKVGYIPMGSSNDFARDMEIQNDVCVQFKKILQNPETILLDVGVIKTESLVKRFIVSCGVGYDAAVCAETDRSKLKVILNKIKLGKLTYLGVALRQLFVTPRVMAKISYKDQNDQMQKMEGRLMSMPCMIHRFEGGGFMFAPDANPKDGIFDGCFISDMPLPKMMRALPKVYDGSHYKFKEVIKLLFKEIKVELESPLWVHADGETWEPSKSFSVENAGKMELIY